MFCAHEFLGESRECVRCGALVVPAERGLAHVAEARRILAERSAARPLPSLHDPE